MTITAEPRPPKVRTRPAGSKSLFDPAIMRRATVDSFVKLNPRQMMRTGEAAYAELGLDNATPGQLLDAIATHPILLERPIFVVGDRAVVARPPERLLELL